MLSKFIEKINRKQFPLFPPCWACLCVDMRPARGTNWAYHASNYTLGIGCGHIDIDPDKHIKMGASQA